MNRAAVGHVKLVSPLLALGPGKFRQDCPHFSHIAGLKLLRAPRGLKAVAESLRSGQFRGVANDHATKRVLFTAAGMAIMDYR